MFAQWKLYGMIALVIGAFAGAWVIQEWRHDAMLVAAMDKQRKEHAVLTEKLEASRAEAEKERQRRGRLSRTFARRLNELQSNSMCFSDDTRYRMLQDYLEAHRSTETDE